MASAAALFPAEAPDGPVRFGDYRVLSRIAEGGMGIILRGQDCVDGRIVALKTVRSARPADAAGIRREIAALQRVDHPGIVQLYDDGLWSGMPWMAMELLEGQTLYHEIVSLWPHALGPSLDGLPTVPARDRARRGSDFGWLGRAPAPAAAGRLDGVFSIVGQLCSALEHLHGQGLVHRDLKPTNVMIGGDGRATLFDFGLACRTRELGSSDVCIGTMEYAAPEQIRGEDVDARADIYSLGCVLYELCTGQRPFGGETSLAVADSQLRYEPRAPSELVADLPCALEDLLLRMLAKRADDRPATAAEVGEHLTRIAARLGGSADERLDADVSILGSVNGGGTGRASGRSATAWALELPARPGGWGAG